LAKYTTETWIEKAKEKYNNRFDYSLTKYIDSYNKVKIKCIEHNTTFEVDPINFIRTSSSGNFCPICKVNGKFTSNEFSKLIEKNWGHKYTFEKTIFTNTRSLVTVTCPIHGDFPIKAKNLTCSLSQYSLCPKCIENDLKNNLNLVKKYTENIELGNEPGVFYTLKVTHIPTKIEFIKIGITSTSTNQRYIGAKYKDFEFEILDEVFDSNLNVAIIEKKFKEDNEDNRFYIPKDILFAGRTECYVLNDEYQLKANQVKFIRDSLIVKQNNICPICKNEIIMPTLDHHHSKGISGSGKVRGVLCNRCNRFIGTIENNILRNGYNISDIPDILRNISSYMMDKQSIYIHPTEAPRVQLVSKRNYNKLKKAYCLKAKFPEYPKSSKLTIQLKKLFELYEIEPYN